MIGIGLMGRGLVHQLARMPGMTPALIVARNVERAVSAYRAAGFETSSVIVTDDPLRLGAAVWAGRPLVTTDIELAAEVAPVDVFIECTGAVEYGAGAALACIRNGRHVVSLNAEADGTVGWLLKQQGGPRRRRLLQQPTAISPASSCGMIEYCRGCGFEVLRRRQLQGLHEHPCHARLRSWSGPSSRTPARA